MIGSDGGERVKDPPVPFQLWAAAKIKAMTPTQLQLSLTRVECAPLGIPGNWVLFAFPFQFVQGPGLLVQLVETNHDWRLVHTDGRPHQKNPDPTFDGDGVGHWEGDTLVIDVIALNDHTWNTRSGNRTCLDAARQRAMPACRLLQVRAFKQYSQRSRAQIL
jgi:hypothetical protein